MKYGGGKYGSAKYGASIAVNVTISVGVQQSCVTIKSSNVSVNISTGVQQTLTFTSHSKEIKYGIVIIHNGINELLISKKSSRSPPFTDTVGTNENAIVKKSVKYNMKTSCLLSCIFTTNKTALTVILNSLKGTISIIYFKGKAYYVEQQYDLSDIHTINYAYIKSKNLTYNIAVKSSTNSFTATHKLDTSITAIHNMSCSKTVTQNLNKSEVVKIVQNISG